MAMEKKHFRMAEVILENINIINDKEKVDRQMKRIMNKVIVIMDNMKMI